METRKRKPLSDLTNEYNLIPTSALRKLVSSSSNPNSILKPPISILKSNSSSRNQKLCYDSSSTLNRSDTRSDTSIGSSSINATGNSRIVRFQTPKRPINSVTSPGNEGSKDVALSRKQTTDKLKKEREAASVTVSSTPVDKRKDKGKTIAVPFSCPTPEKTKDTENAICKPCCSLDKTKEKDLENRSLFSGSLEKVKEFGKGILNPSSCSHEKTANGKTILSSSGCSMGKTEELGKGMHNSSSFLLGKIKEKGKSLNSFGYSHDKTREKEKAILHPPNIVDITKHKGSSVAVAVNCPPPKRKFERKKKDAGASSCPPVLRTKNIQNDLDEAGDVKSSKSFKKKRCPQPKSSGECCLPLDFVEQQRAYFKEVDEFELPEEEISLNELD